MSDIKPGYVKVIDRIHIDDSHRHELITGCKYLADIVDGLNEKYNTNAYRLKVVFHNDYQSSLEIAILESIIVLHMEIPIKDNRLESIHIGYINRIDKQISGNTIISIAKHFGHILNVEELTLEDHSKLRGICGFNTINMITLYILSTGISWYNSKGFVSESFDIEKQHNSQLLTINIDDFLKYHCNRQQPRWATPCNDGMNKFFEFFENYNKQYPFLKDNGLVLTKSMTVQEVFTRIKKFILRNMPTSRISLHKMVCEHLHWLFHNIAVVSPERRPTTDPYNILYNEFLIYNLIDTPPLPRQSVLRISSNKLPSTRRTTSSRKRPTKSSTRKRLTIG